MADGYEGSWCPQCGPDVRVDEDGCCLGCGSSAVGDGADAAVRLRAKLTRITVLLTRNGCDCECDCDTEGHDDDCERCLACRIGDVLQE